MIQAPLDISFDEPLCSSPVFVDAVEGGVASLVRSESVGAFRELWVVVGFQDGPYYFLNYLV